MKKRETSVTELLARVASEPELIDRLINMFFEDIRGRVKRRLSLEMAARISETEVANDVAKNLAVVLEAGSPQLECSADLRRFLALLVVCRVSDAVEREQRQIRDPKRNRTSLDDSDAMYVDDPADRIAKEEAIQALSAIVNDVLEEIKDEARRCYLSIVVATGDSAADALAKLPTLGRPPSLRTCQLWIQQFREQVQVRMRANGWMPEDLV